MRFFSFVFLFIFSLNIAAQSPAVSNLFKEGTRAANAGQFEQALKSYKTALFAAENEYVTDAYRAQLRYNIGVCYFRTDRYELAANEFRSAILLKKDYARAHYALGMAESRRRNWKSASVSFQNVLQHDPTNGEAWFDLASTSLALNDLETAETAFARSIAFGSRDSALSHNNIGVILAVKGDLSAAEKAFETAIELSNDRLPEAKRNLVFIRSKRELVARDFQYAGRELGALGV